MITITQKETWPLPVESVYNNKGEPIFLKNKFTFLPASGINL